MTALETGTLTGWHFAAERLRDGRPLPKKGERLLHEGECLPCKKGLHFSERAIDALWFAPGPFVARVLGPADALDHEGNKRCGSWREGLTDYVDATRLLHEFACWCATQALDVQKARGHKVDPRSRAAIDVKLAWLDGRATDKELAAAWDAAWDAAWAAAGAAAGAAARAAARAAAGDAARAAAGATVRAAAGAAAGAAQNTELERRLAELIGGSK